MTFIEPVVGVTCATRLFEAAVKHSLVHAAAAAHRNSVTEKEPAAIIT